MAHVGHDVAAATVLQVGSHLQIEVEAGCAPTASEAELPASGMAIEVRGLKIVQARIGIRIMMVEWGQVNQGGSGRPAEVRGVSRLGSRKELLSMFSPGVIFSAVLPGCFSLLGILDLW
jgi:hypothetical protein